MPQQAACSNMQQHAAAACSMQQKPLEDSQLDCSGQSARAPPTLTRLRTRSELRQGGHLRAHRARRRRPAISLAPGCQALVVAGREGVLHLAPPGPAFWFMALWRVERGSMQLRGSLHSAATAAGWRAAAVGGSAEVDAPSTPSTPSEPGRSARLLLSGTTQMNGLMPLALIRPLAPLASMRCSSATICRCAPSASAAASPRSKQNRSARWKSSCTHWLNGST
mmetsp:Transcript_17070/g.54285  ORF Transcript_17070/g.54285 Transcript_17070/m.54285 type:complete len:223 (-) Transcript_17070:829-1497(-)